MRKLIILDLRDTLVRGSNGQAYADLEATLRMLQQAKFDVMLYSMSEPWTYQTLVKYADVFAQVGRIVLVKQKSAADVRALGTAYDNVCMVGDGPEEKAIAQELGYPFLAVGPEGLQATGLEAWVDRLTI